MPSITWTRQQGDTGPDLTVTVRELPVGSQRTGDPVDLTAVTSMTSKVVRLQDLAVVADDTATFDAGGDVDRDLTANISARPGLYGVAFTAIFADSTIRRFPTSGDHYFLRIRGTLAEGYVWTAPPGGGEYQIRSEKGAADGYAGLDSEGEVPAGQLAVTGTPDATTFLRGDQVWATPPGGVGAVAEEFVQASPLATWTINHTLSYRPAVTVIDGSGTRVYPQIDYVGASQVVVSHSQPQSGTALLS